MSENVSSKLGVKSAEINNWLSLSKRVILALQHLIAMFGATVLVPILTGLNPSVALVSAGLGTLIFHAVTKRKVPVFLGSSFAFIGGIIAVKEAHSGDLSYAQGGILVAGLIYVLMSFLIKKIGMDFIRRYLPSHVIGAMIIVIGLNLVPVAFNMASGNFLLAIITLGTALVISFFGKGFIKQLSILIAVVVGYVVAQIIGQVDPSSFVNAPMFAIPAFTLPKFSVSAIAVLAPVVLAVFMEHVGDITTNGQVVGQDFITDPGLNRTLLGDGLATLLAGFIGGPANTTYGENTGVLAITKNYDPSILRLAAVFAIVLGFVAKIGGFLGTIPTPVMGGISMMLFSMIALVGVQTIKNNKVQFNVINVIVMLVVLVLGLWGSYFQNITGINIGIKINETVSITGLSLAAIVGVVLNGTLNMIIPASKRA
ncbi:uracil-xanthine permease family protein [Alkaliphilus serpentinus]|uniref:Uracil-xanthine permease n=1 Tax=Alkaliphilus serpentinus TaxID=1482731 RepID=A0A833M8L0_9FIRM|nr:uracil-xanthine permease family protein [Alkaliphilus serpentinus]KAB3526250.1 uracil-xanthine permease [Alkaliphilus serpentinus]